MVSIKSNDCDLQEAGGAQEEGFAGPAVDGSQESEQVKKFLEKEQEAFQRLGVPSIDEPDTPRDEDPTEVSPDPGVDVRECTVHKHANICLRVLIILCGLILVCLLVLIRSLQDSIDIQHLPCYKYYMP